jgi:hypothetical protein
MPALIFGRRALIGAGRSGSSSAKAREAKQKRARMECFIFVCPTFDVMSPRHCGEHEKEIEMIMGG